MRRILGWFVLSTRGMLDLFVVGGSLALLTVVTTSPEVLGYLPVAEITTVLGLASMAAGATSAVFGCAIGRLTGDKRATWLAVALALYVGVRLLPTGSNLNHMDFRMEGKGVLFITGHFGFWELHAIAHPLRFEPIGVLARALDNVRINTVLERIRQCTGNTVIYRQGTIRRVMRMLQGGHGVAVLIDQHIHGPDAVYVEFFERPAATTSVVAALALRTGAPVVPVFALPIGGGRYRMIYEHPIEPPPSGAEDAIREFTQRCTDVLEMYVRRHPDLWLWMHRRWRDSGPSTDAVPGMFPSAEHDIEEQA